MMNPLDKATTKAMIDYKINQLAENRVVHPAHPEIVMIDVPEERGAIVAARQYIGLTLIRFGARLAGIGMQTRIGTPV
jgi:hypothetical protein